MKQIVVIQGKKKELPIYSIDVDKIYRNPKCKPVVINGERVLMYE